MLNSLFKYYWICNLRIEEKRGNKEIGSSLEAALTIKLNRKNLEIIKGVDLSELCITSSAITEEISQNEILVEAIKSEGDKCPVCWKISKSGCERHSKK